MKMLLTVFAVALVALLWSGTPSANAAGPTPPTPSGTYWHDMNACQYIRLFPGIDDGTVTVECWTPNVDPPVAIETCSYVQLLPGTEVGTISVQCQVPEQDSLWITSPPIQLSPAHRRNARQRPSGRESRAGSRMPSPITLPESQPSGRR